MKTNMKKLAAWMLALLLVLPIIPAIGDDTVEATLHPNTNTIFRDKLKVTCESPIIAVGASVQLNATENYTLEWSSSDENVATVDAGGLVTAVAAGKVKITASEGTYSDSITLRVIDSDKTPKSETDETSEGEEKDEGEPEATSADESMIIVINADKEKVTYDGEAHSVSYTAVSNSPSFDETKVEMVNPNRVVSGRDCGVYQTKYEPEDFTYDGSAENVEFIVSNGWLQIRPASVAVKLASFTKKWGDADPDLKKGMVVEGLCGDDTFEMLNLEVTREKGEKAGSYSVMVADTERENGNYRVSVTEGILVIEMPPVKIKSSMEGITEAAAGTEVFLTAEMEGLNTERFNIQWQMGDTRDADSMTDIEGANEPVYSYILDQNTAGKYFRVLITLK